MRPAVREPADYVKGQTVLAEWRKDQWYAGTISKVTAKGFSVRFLDGDQREFGRRSTKLLAVTAALPFKRYYSGPYTACHAGWLAQLRKPPRTDRTTWVVSEGLSAPPYGWHVGRLVEVKPNGRPPGCLIRFNSGEEEWRHRPEGTFYLEHEAPYLLGGPYDEAEVRKALGKSPRSPIPKPVATVKKAKPVPRPAPAAVGQRVLATAGAWTGDQWRGGRIDEVRKDVGLVAIAFDDGKRLGHIAFDPGRSQDHNGPVTHYYPIADDVVLDDRLYSTPEVEAIWKKHGLRSDGAHP